MQRTTAMKGRPEASDFAGPSEAGEHTAEISIDPQMFETICRRGLRRLRDIESSSQAILKLHRNRGVLEARGSKSAIAEVYRQLECLTGPRIAVSTANWAELM